MAVKILSEEWVKEFGKAINNNPAYKQAAVLWCCVMLLHIDQINNIKKDKKYKL
jgi:hypothetical protein